MKKSLILGLALVAVLPTLALAGDQAAKTEVGPRFEAYDEVIDTLTIVRIDAASRMVTLKDADGDTIAIKAGEEVRNFAQLRVNDLVVMTYKQNFTVSVDTAGVAELTKETTTGRAPLGGKPSASVTEKTQVKAAITEIDTKAGTVTLRTTNGELFTITPLVPENLQTVKVGDLVVFTHTMTSAISVEKPAAAKGAAKKPAPAKKK
jgi:hypothetical protein